MSAQNLKSCLNQELAANDVAHTVLGTVLRDEPWQDLGFGRRPRYGAFIQRFRPEWKVALEKTALKEMVILFTTAYLAAELIAEEDIDRVVEIYIDGTKPTRELWRSLGYHSRSEAQLQLRNAIAAYAAAGPAKWPQMLISRLSVADVPEPKVAARLIAGTLRFSETVRGMVGLLRQQNRSPNASSQQLGAP